MEVNNYMNLEFKNWSERFKNELTDLGIFFEDGRMPISPIILKKEKIYEWEKELPKLLELGRKVTFNNKSQVRPDHKEIAELYKNESIPGIMRPDGILVDDQLKIIEMNIESAVGGTWEVDFIQYWIQQNPLSQAPSHAEYPSVKDGIKRFLIEIKRESQTNIKEEEINIALMGFNDFDQFYKDLTEEMVEWIEEAVGIRAFFVTPENLRAAADYITDGIRNYHILYRIGTLVHPQEKVKEMIRVIKEAWNTDTRVYSNPADLFMDHKGIVAELSEQIENNGRLTSCEIDLINKYIPWTRTIKKRDVIYKGKQYNLLDLILSNKNQFVIKRSHSHVGEYVFIGAETKDDRWEDLVHKIGMDSTQWIVQENLESPFYDFQYYHSTKGIITESKRFTLSPYIFGSHLGGVLVRIEDDSNKRVLALPSNSCMSSTGVAVL